MIEWNSVENDVHRKLQDCVHKHAWDDVSKFPRILTSPKPTSGSGYFGIPTTRAHPVRLVLYV